MYFRTVLNRKNKRRDKYGVCFYGLLAVAFIAFVVLVIRSYRKKLVSGCCGASDESVKKNKVADKDKSHYPYEKLLLLTEWSVKTVPQE